MKKIFLVCISVALLCGVGKIVSHQTSQRYNFGRQAPFQDESGCRGIVQQIYNQGQQDERFRVAIGNNREVMCDADLTRQERRSIRVGSQVFVSLFRNDRTRGRIVTIVPIGLP